MSCVPVPVKKTALVFALKVPLSMRFPANIKSPPFKLDNVNVPEFVKLPNTVNAWFMGVAFKVNVEPEFTVKLPAH